MKRGREDGLEEEIETIKVEIEALKGEKAEWKAKAEAAERAGDNALATEHWKDYRLINTQLASVQQRLALKEATLVEESKLKREKAFPPDWPSFLPGPVRKPSAATESALNGKLVFGSPAIHKMAFHSLQCCVAEAATPVDDIFVGAAGDILALLRRFGSNEDFGFFKGAVQVQEELAHTSWLTDLLHHHFPRSEDLYLHWMHQLPDPQAGRMDITMYVSSSLNGPTVPVAVLEVGFKGSTKQWQAAAYAVNIAPQLRDGGRSLLSLELNLGNSQDLPLAVLRCYAPASADEVKAFDGQKFLWRSTIWRGDANEVHLGKVLKALVEAAPMALGSANLKEFQRVGANVCVSNKHILKFFDYRYQYVVKEQRRSPDLSLKYLQAEKEIQADNLDVISYPLVDGSHHAAFIQDFVDVAKELRSLHDEDICHGDIRAYNMLFCVEGPSHLLDFDFSGPAGSKKYPIGYSSDVNDARRHPKAFSGARLAKDHDCFSLASVMELHACEKRGEIWTSIIDLVRGSKLADAIQKMQEVAELELQPSELLQQLAQTATGSPPRK